MGNCLGDGSNGNTSVAPNNSPDGNAREEAAPDWDSYEIGEKEIRAVFDAVFYVFDKDSRGYLTGDQFGTLMTTFANDCRPPVSITPRELASFQDILDKDKNGIVEQDEFVSFFFDLAWITPEDRAAFVKVRLLVFFDSCWSCCFLISFRSIYCPAISSAYPVCWQCYITIGYIPACQWNCCCCVF